MTATVRVDATEVVRLECRPARGGTRYKLVVLWRGKVVTFCRLSGSAARLRAVADAIRRAVPPPRRKATKRSRAAAAA